MRAEQLAVVQGWDHTRATMKRWKRTPGRCCGVAGVAAGDPPGAAAGLAAPARAARAVRALPPAGGLVDRRRARRVEPAVGRHVRHHGGRASPYRGGCRDRALGHSRPSFARFGVAILSEATDELREDPPMAANITDVSDNNFQAEVLENDTPVLVDFWAPWCGPCRVVAPALEEIAEARDDLRIVKLNVDDNQQTAAQYQVLAIPTMILFRNGQEAKRIQGAMPKKRIEAELQPALA